MTPSHKVSQTSTWPRACQTSTVPNKRCGLLCNIPVVINTWVHLDCQVQRTQPPVDPHYETYKGWFLSWMWWFLHFTLLHGDYILPNFLWDKFYLKFQPFKSWFSFPCQTLSLIIILNSDPDENCFVFIRGWLQNNFKKSSLNIAAFIGQNK